MKVRLFLLEARTCHHQPELLTDHVHPTGVAEELEKWRQGQSESHIHNSKICDRNSASEEGM
jgi:hypothetical protein